MDVGAYAEVTNRKATRHRMALHSQVHPGIDMEIAMQALDNMGIGTTVRMVPFKRVLAMLKEGQADLTTSLSFRQDRDSYLLWSRTYRTGASYAFFCRKGSAFMPGRLEDLRGRAVGVARGFVFPPTFADDPAIRKVEAPHIASLMHMLLAGRFDALIVNSLADAMNCWPPA